MTNKSVEESWKTIRSGLQAAAEEVLGKGKGVKKKP